MGDAGTVLLAAIAVVPSTGAVVVTYLLGRSQRDRIQSSVNGTHQAVVTELAAVRSELLRERSMSAAVDLERARVAPAEERDKP